MKNRGKYRKKIEENIGKIQNNTEKLWKMPKKYRKY